MKKLSYFLLSLFLVVSACGCSVKNNLNNTSIRDYPELLEKLGKKCFTPKRNFFLLEQSSDSTCRITWGNGKVTRSGQEEIDFNLARRLHYQWENSEYLILKGGTGSGAWLNFILPFSKSEKVKAYENLLCFDPKDNLVASQYFNDTVLVVQNLKTDQKQYIVLKDTPCEAASNLYCIDSIGIKNKELYLKWVTANLENDSTRIFEEKRFQIKI